MSVRIRLGRRLLTALVVVAVPVSMAGLSPLISATSSDTGTVAPPAATVGYLQQHEPVDLPAGLHPQVVAEQTTISGGLSLRTKADRNRKIAVSSAKGSHVWTASSLAEHDVPSAALRAYKHAASSIDSSDPGCHLSWTLLAGIGRVESDHGRYGGSVLGNDGVSRPAIVGVALNGKGPVAAVRDTDNGLFDGDKVWDRAVGPMQFIPSTWRGAGRDGDGDGKLSPNDIDDASLAAAAYLCHSGGNLAEHSSVESAVFGYNPSDYYVALVTAFAHGYATGVFVIPSPPVAAGAGDGVVHLRSHHRAAARAAAKARARALAARRAARLARARAAASHVSASTPVVHHTVRHRPPSTGTSPPPSPAPSPPPPPKVLTASGPVTAVDGGGWSIGGVKLATGDLSPIAAKDYDNDGTVEPTATELDGLVASGVGVTLSYTTAPLTVVGFGLT